MKDNIFGSEAFVLLTKMEMHYRRNEFQNFLQNLALDAHDALHRKSTLAFIRHCSRVGGGNDKLAIDKGGNLPEKVENHWYITICPHPPPRNSAPLYTPAARHLVPNRSSRYR